MSEAWVLENGYCPISGSALCEYDNNLPVADFYCEKDKEDFELKAKKNSFGRKIVDGAYDTMIRRLKSAENPNLFLLSYEPKKLEVLNFALIPSHFFVTDTIEKRKPLSPTARRADWVGCNILLDKIPQSGLIFYVRGGKVEDKGSVLQKWQKTLFLRDEKDIELKGWVLEVMKVIDKLGKERFTLDEIYAFEDEFAESYPDNSHIKAKIRQQLQILRDRGYLDFIERGHYRLT